MQQEIISGLKINWLQKRNEIYDALRQREIPDNEIYVYEGEDKEGKFYWILTQSWVYDVSHLGEVRTREHVIFALSKAWLQGQLDRLDADCFECGTSKQE